ncbi:MAG: tRNA 4-thiouridine(8) synthase ThiI [Candidatus Woesearchaeota archaeon]|nr:tRNA 4-thiouridine(8) synthase ThiI [Candidatus Woesearchaeota archaeon]
MENSGAKKEENSKMNRIIVRYNEIFLKGQNRSFFEKALARNIKLCLKKHNLHYERLSRYTGRIIVFSDEEVREKCACLKQVFGIASFSAAEEIPASGESDVQRMKEEALKLFQKNGISPDKTFRIIAKRMDKKFPVDSQKLNEELGGFVQEKTNAKVKLMQPELYVGIEILNKTAYLFTEKTPGPGGLPTGTEGKVLCLLSGGIDSPVAAWLMMRRGCKAVLLYIDNSPFADSSRLERAKKTAEKLSEYYYGDKLKLYVVTAGNALSEFKKINNRFTCIFCKRTMFRIASEIAKKESASAIVDGSSLAQVASQTVSNMSSINNASELMVLRPLIGLDKNDIIKMAEQIGTYQISIEKTTGCSAVPLHPATKSDEKEIEFLESKISVKKELEKSMATEKIIELN